jgi:hypothetical protein
VKWSRQNCSVETMNQYIGQLAGWLPITLVSPVSETLFIIPLTYVVEILRVSISPSVVTERE